jgi:hydrogenase maturation protease
MKTTTEATLLVIGYGNPLRQDDGAGPQVADQVAALALPGVRTIACHQLLPEMAAEIAGVMAVVFVDASDDGGDSVQLRPLAASESAEVMTHAPGPATLLALAREIGGEAPPAWLLTIPATHFGYDFETTSETSQAIAVAVREVEKLAAEWTY